nr:hypothetical protein [Tanacetum cinerariifolium]
MEEMMREWMARQTEVNERMKDQGDVLFIKEDEIKPIPTMPNLNLNDVLLNHVGGEELNSIDGVGNRVLTKKDDNGNGGRCLEQKVTVLIRLALKDELRKLKGKYLADNTVTKHNIAPKMLKVDVEPLAPRLLNNRTVHSDNLRLTQEQVAILQKVVEHGKSQNPLNNSLDHALGNACPLTRVTTTTEVFVRKPTALEIDTPIPVVTLVYSRKPKKSKTSVPISKPRIINSISANNKEHSKS